MVSVENSLSNHSLHCFSLQPWLPIGVIDRAMSSEEGVEHAKLVELNVQRLTCISLVARDISSTKEHS